MKSILICKAPRAHCKIRSRQAIGSVMYSRSVAGATNARAMERRDGALRRRSSSCPLRSVMGCSTVWGAVVQHIPSICAEMKETGIPLLFSVDEDWIGSCMATFLISRAYCGEFGAVSVCSLLFCLEGALEIHGIVSNASM